MQGEDDGKGASRAADTMTDPSSRAGDNRQLPQGDIEADRGAVEDQGDGAAHEPPKGHSESIEGHGVEV
jgi:hypothetical protein